MTRVLSGAALLLVAILVVWFAPAPLFLAAATALVVLACIECAGLARAGGFHLPPVVVCTAAALTCVAFATSQTGGMSGRVPLHVVLMVAFLVLGTLSVVRWRGESGALGSMGAALLPSLYVGLPIGAMCAVRETRGREALFLLMLTVIVSDTGQYYTGRAFGRRPLAATVSPKKTIEGAIGGFLFGALLLATLGHWWLPTVSPAVRVLLGIAVVAVGIVGDLFESMLKRSAGVKDSSSLIPGHGGVLDRIDALLFAAPLYYVAFTYLP
jgi:phosphatidate cytidylyltransferase